MTGVGGRVVEEEVDVDRPPMEDPNSMEYLFFKLLHPK